MIRKLFILLPIFILSMNQNLLSQNTYYIHSIPDSVKFELFNSDTLFFEGATPCTVKTTIYSPIIKMDEENYNPLFDTLKQNNSLYEFYPVPKGQLLRCVKKFACGPHPKAVAFTPDQSELWVTCLAGPPSVEVYSTSSWKKIHSFNLGKYGAVEIKFSRSGDKAYVSQMESNQVYEINTETKKVIRKFNTGGRWCKIMELNSSETTLWVSNWITNDVSEINLLTGKIDHLYKTAKTPRGLYYHSADSSLYCASFGEGYIEKFSLPDTAEVDTLYKGGYAMRHFTPDTIRNILYVSDMGRRKVYSINLKNDKISHFVYTGSNPNTIDLTPDGKIMAVSNRGKNNKKSYLLKGPEWGVVQLFDTESGKLLDVIIGGNQCTGLDISPDGTLLAFSDFLDDRINIYRLPPVQELKKGNGGRAGTWPKDVVRDSVKTTD